tara:strand:- start:155 stop:886 length:732 start_codon:yes stop_codon:yes gene_type:complete
MSQHDFNIANQSFPATRTDLNNALVALASNSSGDAEPGTTYANQWWYETDTNILKIRNEANNAWIEIATLDQTSNNVLSITTQGLTLGATALTATGVEINKLSGATVSTTELNQLDAITRGSILYGNASGATARLAKGAAGTVLTSDGTDIAWAASSAASTTVGDVGTYAMLYEDGANLATRNPGDDVVNSGSTLAYAGIKAVGTGNVLTQGTYPAGTWRLMGSYNTATSTNDDPISLWLRIS